MAPHTVNEQWKKSMRHMMVRPRALLYASAFALVASMGGGSLLVSSAYAQEAAQAPRFEVDPFWPKPLPNN